MFYFTSSIEGNIRALYNGRFAFLPGIGFEKATELLNRIKTKESETERDKREPIVEEFQHSKVMLKCKTGLFLNGFRIVARILWLTCHCQAAVLYYYTLRSFFYAVMYPIHETAVQTNNTEGINEKIRNGDRLIWEKWSAHTHSKMVWFGLKLLAPVMRILGYSMARSFAVITQDYSDKGLEEHNVAIGGVINDIGPTGKQNPSIFRRVLMFIRLETWIKNNFADDWGWMILKFLAENEHFEETKRIAESLIDSTNEDHVKRFASFEDYAFSLLGIVSEWVYLPGITHSLNILDAVDRREITPPENWTSDPRLSKLVNYFYLHGN